MFDNTIKFFVLIIGFLFSYHIAFANDEQEGVPEPFLVGYYQSPPFAEKIETGEVVGLSNWLWKQIAKDENIPYKLVDFSDREEPLNEIVDALATGEVDMSLTPLTITSERSTKIEFSQPYFVSNLGVVHREKSSLLKTLDFIRSFLSKEFLRTIFALLLVMLVFGTLIWIFERKNNASQFQRGWKGILNGIWWSAVTMTTVGYGDRYPKSWGGKTVALIWMFTAIMIISSFTASIASSLTVRQIKTNTNSIDDIKSLSVGTVDGSATEEFLRENFFKNITTFPELQSGLQGVVKKDVELFVYDEPFLRHQLTKQENTELELLPIRFHVDLYAFGFRPDFHPELLNKINHQIIAIKDKQKWSIALSEFNINEI